MLLTKEVEIKVNGATASYYKSLGYEIPMRKASKSYYDRTKKEFVYDTSKTIVVKVSDLPKYSEICVNVLCDMCKKNITPVRYADYNIAMDTMGSCVCKSCSYIRGEQTKVARYGDVYFKTEEFKNQRKMTCLDKYGVESPLQNKKIMEKVRSTNLQKYGCVSPSQVPEFKEKARLTALEHFGVECPSKCDEIKEKTRNTNLQRYGVPYTQQAPEVRAKGNETLCRNGTQKTSKQQLYLCFLYGGKINYAISYYAVDICFPEEKLVVEYDGGGHDLRVTLGRLTQEEFNKREIIRNAVIKREGYKTIRIISRKDLLPTDPILLQMLSEAKQYFSETAHSWVTYNIDESRMINATNKDTSGIPYSFGELRKIKDSDLPNNTNINNTNLKGA
jgi:very-short-patch-repair endonuclease